MIARPRSHPQAAPESRPSTEDEYVRALSDLKLPETDDTKQFIDDEWDAGNSLKGFQLPPDVSHHEFFILVSEMEKVAAETGYRYFPTPSQLIRATREGVATLGPDGINQWFLRMHPELAHKFPHLRYGLTRDQYEGRLSSYQDAIQNEVGDSPGSDNSWVQMAMTQRWSPSRLRSEFVKRARDDPRWAYLRHGMNYSDWQTYKAEHHQEMVSRYGFNVTEQQMLQGLDNPLQKFETQAGHLVQQGESAAAQTGDRSGYSSTVR